MKIVMTDCGWDSIDLERQHLPAGAEVLGFQCRTEEAVMEACREADAVLAEYAPFTRRVLASLERCRIISIAATGVDNIDLGAARDLGIAVANVPGYCAPEVADHTLALLLAAVRKLIPCHENVRKGVWDFGQVPSLRRLEGQVLGLVGFGQIARMVAVRAKAFDLAVLACDPLVDRSRMEALGVRPAGLEELLEASDIISLHLPVTERTAGLFDAEKFRMMKKQPIFINTSRGRLVVEQDLVDALQRGLVRHACLDVLNVEPPTFREAVFRLPNVTITPHVGFFSEEAVEEVRRRAAQNVTRFLQGDLAGLTLVGG